MKKWQFKQEMKRIAALLLSFVLLFDALEISAPAPVVRAMERSFSAFCAVTSFAALPQETRVQTLPVGAQESDILLPDSLNVTANVLSELPVAEAQAASRTEPAESEQDPDASTEMGGVLPMPEELPVIDDEAQSAALPQSQPQTAAPAVSAADSLGLTIDSIDEVLYEQNTIAIDGVQWRIDKERSAADTFLSDAEHEGAVYTYVAVLPETDSKGNTIVLQDTAKLPEIRVAVAGQKTEGAEPADTESEPETETLTEAKSESEAETGIETETEEETDAEKETGSDQPVVESEEESESGKDAETECETEAAQNEIEKTTEEEKLTEAATERVTEAPQTEIEKTTETEKATEVQSKTETEAETEELTEAENGTEEITESEAETETESETEIETEIETETDAEKETGSDKVMEETEIESETETETEESTEFESEMGEFTETEFETETGTESETEAPMFGLMSLGDEPMMINETDGKNKPVYNEDGTINLDSFITDVIFTWTNKNGIQVPVEQKDGKYEFPTEHTLGFTLNYAIPSGVISEDHYTVVYQLPDAFDYTKEITGDIVWSGSESGKAGTYRIEPGGKITLTFDDPTFLAMDTDFTGYVTFTSWVSKDKVAQEGSLEFSDKVHYTFTFTEKIEEGSSSKDSSFNAKKSDPTFDGENLKYSIVVTPGKEGATNVTLKDMPSVSVNGKNFGRNIPFGNIHVRSKSGEEELTELKDLAIYTPSSPDVTEENGQTITTVTYTDVATGTVVCTKVTTEANGNSSTVITPAPGYFMAEQQADGSYFFRLPDMSNDEEYTITYDMDLASALAGTEYDINWDKVKVGNIIMNSHDDWKDQKWWESSNNWLHKTKTSGPKLNEDESSYEIGWKIGINPEHRDLPLDTVFSDKMDLPDTVSWENGNFTVTVIDKDGTENNIDLESTGAAEWIQELFSKSATSGATIEDLLEKLNMSEVDGALTTNKAIQIKYTTTVEKDNLPNGTTQATNTATLNEKGHGVSSGESVGLENTILAKKAVDSKVKFEYATYSKDDAEQTERVLVIPWEATVKMSRNLDAADETTFSIRDEFFANDAYLWITPDDLKDSLKITLDDGTEVKNDLYELLYTTDSWTSYSSVGAGNISGKTKVKGFKIKFKPEAFDIIKGQTLLLEYNLYGDADFMSNLPEWQHIPTRTFKNTVYYGHLEVEATYTKSGDYFNKDSFIGKHEDQNDSTVDYDALDSDTLSSEKLITWRLKTEISDTSVGKPIKFIDRLPKTLNLHSISVEGYYGFYGKTESLTDISTEEGTHNYILHYQSNDGQQSAEIPVTVTNNRDADYILIMAEVPTELTTTGTSVQERSFNMKIEAGIPEDSELVDMASPLTQEQYINYGSMEVGGEFAGEDTNTVTVTKDKSVLKKDGNYVDEGGQRIMHYELRANPSGKVQLDGKTPLTIVDTLTYEPDIDAGDKVLLGEKLVRLVPDSVKAYYYENGVKIYLPAKGHDFSYTYKEEDLSVTHDKTLGERQNILTMEIPDGLAVYIEYDYELQSTQGTEEKKLSWEIKNSAIISGHTDWRAEFDKVVEYQAASASVSKQSVNFYKVDQDNYSIVLPGAVFVLHKWDSASEAWIDVTDTAGETKQYISDDKGKIPVEGLDVMTLYWLEEITPPVGYELSKGNNLETRSSESAGASDYYFYLATSTEAPDGPSGLDIHALSGANTIFIPNKSNGSITARKVWADGTERDRIELTLYQGNGAGYTYQDTQGDHPSLTPVLGNDSQPQKRVIEKDASGDGIVSWDGLSQVDGEGNPIYYYVFETKAGDDDQPIVLDDGSYFIDDYNVEYSNNIGITSGTVTITNSTKSISVEKVWADEEENGHKSDSVKVELYQSFTPPKGEEQETKEIGLNFWAENAADTYYFWRKPTETFGETTYANFVTQEIAGNKIEITLCLRADYSIVKSVSIECDAPVKVDSVQRIDPGPDEWGNKSREQKIIWTVSDVFKSCKFFFKADFDAGWIQDILSLDEIESQDSGLQLPEGDCTFVDSLPDGQHNPVTLSRTENDWHYIWDRLPQTAKDSEGKDRKLYYYVKEVEEGLGDYTPKYSYKYNKDGSLKLVTVTNYPKEESKDTSITVEKKWVDVDGNEIINPTGDWQVELQLYQKQSDGTLSPYPDGTITLPKDGQWTHTWEELPEDCEYYVVETNRKEGFTVTYEGNGEKKSKPEEAAIGGGTITVVNTEQPTQVTVDKKWLNASGESMLSPPSDLQVQMKLYQSKTPPTGTENPGAGSGSSSGSGSGTSSGGGGTVKLIINEGNDTYYGGSEPAVQKEIVADCAIIKIRYFADPGVDGATFETPDKIEIAAGYPKYVQDVVDRNYYFEYKISGLLYYKSSGCELRFKSISDDIWPSNQVGVHDIIFDFTTAPTVSPDPAGGDGDGDGEDDENTGEQTLPSDAKEVSGKTVTLNSDNGWRHTWENLPQYDAKGEKLYYYVEEQNTDKYKSTTYEYKYDEDGTSKVTVTNTLPDEPLSTTTAVKVTKAWMDYGGKPLGNEEIQDFSVEVQLQRREKRAENQDEDDDWVKYDTAILKSTESWTHTWEGLVWKEYDASGKLTCEYEYRVREVKVKDSSGSEVNNFETAYSPNISTSGGYEFTITNTKKKQGIILPSTGSKYPWIFYGIGMTFMLIALVWMRRALKKSYIPSDTGKGGRRSDE